MKLNYRYGDWGAQISSLKKGEFYQSSETRSDGTRYMIPSMRTVNASIYYNFEIGDYDARVKLAIKNIDDERAPLADRFYGCLLYTSPSPRDRQKSRMPSSA